jgi:hypothetical protein
MSVESEYYASTIAVMQEQLRLIMELSLEIANRFDELDDQLNTTAAVAEDKALTDEYYSGHDQGYWEGYDQGQVESEMDKFWYESYDPRTNNDCRCACPDCVEDKSYRMD